MTCNMYTHIYGFFSNMCRSIYTEEERQKKKNPCSAYSVWFSFLINFPWVGQRHLIVDFYSLGLFFVVGLVLGWVGCLLAGLQGRGVFRCFFIFFI